MESKDTIMKPSFELSGGMDKITPEQRIDFVNYLMEREIYEETLEFIKSQYKKECILNEIFESRKIDKIEGPTSFI